MKTWMIYNPVAGHNDVEQEVLKAQKHFQSLGWDVTLQRTQEAGDGQRLAQEARDAGVDLVVAVGGDGTIGQIVAGLVNGEVRLGVIPVGTGNLWAHMLGIPIWSPNNRSGILDAARAISEGETRLVDVGWADGHYFLLWAGLGFDAKVAHEVEPHREIRRTLGNWAYGVTAFVQGLMLRGVRTTVVVDGRAYRHRLLMLIVANAQLYGPNWELAPEAQLDDGWFDVYLFKGVNIIDLLRDISMLMLGKQRADSQVENYRARSISVLSDQPLPLHLDGDPSGSAPVNIRVVPHALRIVVPRWSPNDLFKDGGFEEQAQVETLADRINGGFRKLSVRWQGEGERLWQQLNPQSVTDESEAAEDAGQGS